MIKSKDEVIFANQIHEFERFYDIHRNLCGIICGTKRQFYFENNIKKERIIDETNFIFAIKKLNAFIIDNIHYLKDEDIKEKVENDFYEIEKTFTEDYVFTNLVKNNQTIENKIRLKQKYFRYLIDCLDLSHYLLLNLQSSIMLSTKNIRKFIQYNDAKTFYMNLAHYRDDISHYISNCTFMNSLILFKMILSYHYTYRVFMDEKQITTTDKILSVAYSYLLNDKIVKLLVSYNVKEADVRFESMFFKKLVLRVYSLTNLALSDRGILPKVREVVLFDTTSI